MKKFNIVIILAVILMAIAANNSTASACDLDEDYDLGPAIYMDANGVTHTSDGYAWGPDGVVYFEGIPAPIVATEPDIGPAIWMSADGIVHTSDGRSWSIDNAAVCCAPVIEVEAVTETATDIGSAIWMDANGITHTSDGLAWGPDGIVYYENVDADDYFVMDHETQLGTAIWVDEYGKTHESDKTCYVTLSIDENGVITSSSYIDMVARCETRTTVSYLYSTNQLLVQILNADTSEELLAIVVSLPF